MAILSHPSFVYQRQLVLTTVPGKISDIRTQKLITLTMEINLFGALIVYVLVLPILGPILGCEA